MNFRMWTFLQLCKLIFTFWKILDHSAMLTCPKNRPLKNGLTCRCSKLFGSDSLDSWIFRLINNTNNEPFITCSSIALASWNTRKWLELKTLEYVLPELAQAIQFFGFRTIILAGHTFNLNVICGETCTISNCSGSTLSKINPWQCGIGCYFVNWECIGFICTNLREIRMIDITNPCYFQEIINKTAMNMYICLQSNSNIQFLPSNKRPSNIVFKSDPPLLAIPISDWLNTILSNIEHTQISFCKHRTNRNVLI